MFRLTSVQNPHKLSHLLKLSILHQTLHQTHPTNLLDRQGLRVLEEEKKRKHQQHSPEASTKKPATTGIKLNRGRPCQFTNNPILMFNKYGVLDTE